MAIGDYDALGRAAQLLRAEPEIGWQALEHDVIEAVRATPRGGWPLVVDDPGPGTARGIIRVSDLALAVLVGRALAGDADYAVTNVDVVSEDEDLTGISIEVSGRYLADLPAAVDRARARIAAVVSEVVGSQRVIPITVVVTDVHRR